MVDIRVHIDTLEYTRKGLNTRGAIPLTVGEHNRVVLVRPQRQPSIAASYGGFPPASSFPGPAVLSLLLHAHHGGADAKPLAARITAGELQLFAHSDAAGSSSQNKALTDRRAKAMHALLTRDVGTMLDIAEQEHWNAEIEQVLLRALGCNPGPIDGIFEELTTSAVEAFQTRYGERQYHQQEDNQQHAALNVDGELGPKTRAALIDAYVSHFSVRLNPSSFVEHSPINGCAAHNPAVLPDDARNRRVSLVVHEQALEHPQSVPCSEGDEAACPAMNDDSKHKCMWFREHVVETNIHKAKHYNFLGSWLRLGNGDFFLSALSSVTGIGAFEIEVLGHEGQTLARLPAIEALGVVQVVWSPPPHIVFPDLASFADGPPVGSKLSFVVHESTTGTSDTQPWSTGGTGVLLLHTDIESASAAHAEVSFRLEDVNGRYAQIRRAEDSELSSAGYVSLRFESLPTEGTYTLTMTDHRAAQQKMFEAVPFTQLDEVGNDHGEDIVDPFSLEPIAL